jgi:hypothetical protein
MDDEEMTPVNLHELPPYESLGVTFKKFEKKNKTMLPKIRTMKNRQFHTHNPQRKLNSTKFIKKDFTTFSKNVMKPTLRLKSNLYKNLKFYKGFDIDGKNLESFNNQTKCHENFFKMKELKEKFISFSNDKFFFTLEGQNSSQQFFEISNNSNHYHFRIIFILKSKEFKIENKEIILKPKETKSMGITFNPIQQTLFHNCKLDIIVTNEKISHLNYNDLKKKNPRIEIQKKQVNNCFLGNLKYLKFSCVNS